MTIHDELVLELIKPDMRGKVKGKLVEVIGTSNLRYSNESTYPLSLDRPENDGKMTPDIIVFNEDIQAKHPINKSIAIEVESDLDWDFGNSMRQVKKYEFSKFFPQGVIVIIPKKYERFAPLYISNGFKVWLWDATRIWQCNECGEIYHDKRSLKTYPKCTKKGCNSTQFSLIGIEDMTLEKGFK